jgi:hypothetical protein
VRLAPLLTVLLLAAPARAQETPAATAVESQDATLNAVLKRLDKEPAFAAMIAARIDRSQVAPLIAPNLSGDDRLKAVKVWMAQEPESAARIALGLYGDDAAGNTLFEDALLRQSRLSVLDNTKGNKGVLGRLREAGKDSTLLKRQSEQLSDDEKREITRTLFEGAGAQSGTVLNSAETGRPRPGGSDAGSNSGAAATAFSGFYDRLSAANIHGYSPQLLVLQNALNAHRPPGAPALIETGKLDYATLAYPAWGIEYDVRNLESRLSRDRILALAKLAGVDLSARDWKNPNLEAELLAKVSAERLSPRFKRRAELAAKARAALEAFLAAAAAAKNPALITKELLVELSARQHDAARWITAAALEDDLSRADELDGFLTPALLAAVDAAPAEKDQREAYKARGKDLQDKLSGARADASKAEALLVADGWAASLAEVDRLSASERAARRALERDIPIYSRVPFRFETPQTVARWRLWLDDFMVRWLPSTGYASAILARRARQSRWLSVFLLIAAGDAKGAASAFGALEPAPGR